MTSFDFIADFHVHSKYSRATAKHLDLENLYTAAQIKGITVIGTGDFTHPEWFLQIKEKLVPAEPGLFKLKHDIAVQCDKHIPDRCRNPVRFILASEISNIYKKNNRTRKNHNLVFLPDLETARAFNSRLDRIGNIKSDGRPILGLDARDLLEILLEVNDEGFLIPAHIWTPWFSLLGSKSGFDSLAECFEDLTSHIFAVETGLSSDPAMNWRVSGLDHLTLVSNSDAHSPSTLGREANRFKTQLAYSHIRDAMRTGDPKSFLGTLEFYPEEGKYHFDGHRKCGICYDPKQTKDKKGICPVCNKPLTLGVLHRVEELADRDRSQKPDKTHPYHSIIPLAEILSNIFKVGPKSKKVRSHFNQAIQALGPEFNILLTLSTEELDKAGIPLLSEAVNRVRGNQVAISPGYDGAYGVVKIFKDGERRRLLGQRSLFVMPEPKTDNLAASPKIDLKPFSPSLSAEPDISDTLFYKEQPLPFEPSTDIFCDLNAAQKEAVNYEDGPLLIMAGPGTGKTRTITHRVAYLVTQKNVPPENILAVTFTNKAAQEMKERLLKLFHGESLLPTVGTFHSLCYQILKNEFNGTNDFFHTIIDDQDQHILVKEAIGRANKSGNLSSIDDNDVLAWIITAKQQILSPFDDLSNIQSLGEPSLYIEIYRLYQELLSIFRVMDYEDLIFKTVNLFEKSPPTREAYQQKFKYIFVDEYQDLNYGQYRLIRSLSPPNKNLCVIGDPDQCIYGFRGSDAQYFRRFSDDYPKAKIVFLSQNYRSTETILKGSYQIIQHHRTTSGGSKRIHSGIKGVKTLDILASASEKSEGVSIGKTIEKMVGGTGFDYFDFDKTNHLPISTRERSFSDFAVLYRTQDQGHMISEILEKAGIPCQVVSRNHLIYEKGIRELISYFKLIENRGTLTDLERLALIPRSGIGKQTLQQFKNWCFEKRIPLDEAFSLAKRFPIPGLSNASQRKLDTFITGIQQIAAEVNAQPVDYRLLRLSQMPFIEILLKKNKKSNDRLLLLFSIAKEYQLNVEGFLTALTL